MTESRPKKHGPRDRCGVAVAGPTRLLDLKDLAEHLGVQPGTLHANRARANGRAAGVVAPWWREPDLVLGSSQVWTMETAESMRLARGGN